MSELSSLVVGNLKFVFRTPQTKVTANEAREKCGHEEMQLATISDKELFIQFSLHVDEYMNAENYDIWHVDVYDENGFIFRDSNKKLLDRFFVHSDNIKVVRKYRNVALYSFIDQVNFDSNKVGNYICMSPVAGPRQRLLGFLFGSLIFVVVLVFATLYFVFKRRESRK